MASQWLTGAGEPSLGVGVTTDYYRDTVTNLVYYRENSTTWSIVPAFTPNPDGVGTTWLHGDVSPLTSQGSDGDYFYDETDKIIYRKAGSDWVAKGSLDFIGIYGVQWGNGIGAPANTTPLNNLPAGSFYLDVVTSDIYFKASIEGGLYWELKGQLGGGGGGGSTVVVENSFTSDSTENATSVHLVRATFEFFGSLLDNKLGTTDVIDDLVSMDTDKPLSANQGRVLNDQFVALNPEVLSNKVQDLASPTADTYPSSDAVVNALSNKQNTLADIVTAQTAGSATNIPIVTVNAKGLITAITPTNILNSLDTRTLSTPTPVNLSGLGSRTYIITFNTTFNMDGWISDINECTIKNDHLSASYTITFSATSATYYEEGATNSTEPLGTNSLVLTLRAGEVIRIRPFSSSSYRVTRSMRPCTPISDVLWRNTANDKAISLSHAIGAAFTSNQVWTIPAVDINFGDLPSVATTNSNVLSGTRTRIVSGQSNTVSGINNTVIASNSCTLQNSNGAGGSTVVSSSSVTELFSNTGGNVALACASVQMAGTGSTYLSCNNLTRSVSSNQGGITYIGITGNTFVPSSQALPYRSVQMGLDSTHIAHSSIKGLTSSIGGSTSLQDSAANKPRLYIAQGLGYEFARHEITIVGVETVSPFRSVIAQRVVTYTAQGDTGAVGGSGDTQFSIVGTDVVTGGLAYTITVGNNNGSLRVDCTNNTSANNTNWTATIRSIYG